MIDLFIRPGGAGHLSGLHTFRIVYFEYNDKPLLIPKSAGHRGGFAGTSHGAH